MVKAGDVDTVRRCLMEQGCDGFNSLKFESYLYEQSPEMGHHLQVKPGYQEVIIDIFEDELQSKPKGITNSVAAGAVLVETLKGKQPEEQNREIDKLRQLFMCSQLQG